MGLLPFRLTSPASTFPSISLAAACWAENKAQERKLDLRINEAFFINLSELINVSPRFISPPAAPEQEGGRSLGEARSGLQVLFEGLLS